jgi:hypothetical protein
MQFIRPYSIVWNAAQYAIQHALSLIRYCDREINLMIISQYGMRHNINMQHNMLSLIRYCDRELKALIESIIISILLLGCSLEVLCVS